MSGEEARAAWEAFLAQPGSLENLPEPVAHTRALRRDFFFFSQFGLDPDVPFCTHSCHPMHGECSCQPGWAGLHCNESCPQDTHGPGCQEHCLCLHGGLCLADSGLCRCAPGYTVRLCSTAGKELGR